MSRWSALLCLTLAAETAVWRGPQREVDPTGVRFSDVTRAAGLAEFRLECGATTKDYILESMSGGAAFIDYDQDGWLDIFLVNGSTLDNLRAGEPGPPCRLYRNRRDGTFEDVTERSGAGVRGWGMGVSAADLNGDGWLDLYITQYGANVLLINNRDGTFRSADRAIAVGDWSTGAAFADADRDGDLDLYVARYVGFSLAQLPPPPGGNGLCRYRGLDVYCGPRGLDALTHRFFRQQPDGMFVDATGASGMGVGAAYGMGVIWGDFNNDAWPDLYVANDSMANWLFMNRKDGTFGERGLLAGVALSADGREQAGMGVDAGDYNNDGSIDLYVTNFSHDYNTLYQNLKNGSFEDVSAATGHARASFPYLGWGTAFCDFNNDGWLDIFTANGHVYPQMDLPETGTSYRQRCRLFLNQRGVRFTEVGEAAGLNLPQSGRGAAFGDYDNDGDVDVLVNNLNEAPTLWRNDTRNPNHWVQFALKGVSRNMSAIGARVTIVTQAGTQLGEVRSGGSYLSQNDLRVHFGLGTEKLIRSVRVRWPEGDEEVFGGVTVDRTWRLEKGSGRAGPAQK